MSNGGNSRSHDQKAQQVDDRCRQQPEITPGLHEQIAKQDGSYTRFCEIVKREGITHYAESGEPHRKAFHAAVENSK